MTADQSAYIAPTEDQVKIIKAKDLLRRALEFVQPHKDPFETDEGYKAYRLRDEISLYVKDA